MKVVTGAFYFVVAIAIYSVLTKVAERTGRRSANVEMAIAALALIWPLWGEFAIIAILAFILNKVLQKLAASKSVSTKQKSSFTAQNGEY